MDENRPGYARISRTSADGGRREQIEKKYVKKEILSASAAEPSYINNDLIINNERFVMEARTVVAAD